ncbi:MAG: DNA-binding protein [Proteobacteria bacterium]|nr:MAG: DNA-binding protein [Pseudomonadota bacterium]
MATLNDAPQLLTVPEIAERLRLTEEHTRRLLRSGQLPGVKIGRGWRIEARVLAQWVNEKVFTK